MAKINNDLIIKNNIRKLVVIETILTEYVNSYKEVYCKLKRVENIDFENAINNEYEEIANKKIIELKTINLYFVKER